MSSHPRRGSIGVFDSGFGGLYILRSVIRALPEYNYVYLGDTARVPYGTRSKETIVEFTKQAVDFLFKQECELIIFACFTASSEALRRIQRAYLPKRYPHKKVLGVLVPVSEALAETTRNRRVGVLATESTISSGAFTRELAKRNARISVFEKACPLLVPLVEAGEEASPLARAALNTYLAPIVRKKIDTLVLGCTHYGILKKEIRRLTGTRVHIIAGEDVIPEKLEEYLFRHPEIEKKLGKNKKRRFYSTDLSPRFEKLGSRFFGKPIRVKKIRL